MSLLITVHSHPNNFGKITSRLALAVGRLLVLLVSVLLCLPVVLLPVTTSVPTWVWILFAIADVLLILLQFRFVTWVQGDPG